MPPTKEVELEVTHTPREAPGSGAGESEARSSPWGGPRTRVLNAIKFQRQFQGHGSQQRTSSEIKCSNMIQKQPGQMCKTAHHSMSVYTLNMNPMDNMAFLLNSSETHMGESGRRVKMLMN